MRRLGGYNKKPALKHLSNLQVGKEIQKRVLSTVEVGKDIEFEYNGATVTGIVRYIGSTDFSPGKWCGIELSESTGKHNGTVNGKCYFVCRDSYGIFIRFNKVADKHILKTTSESHIPTNTDMRITVKSVKAKPLPLADENDSISYNGDSKAKPTIMNNSLIKSSVKSYIKSKKDKKLTTRELLNGIRKEKERASKVTAKNVVVSSFTAPVPVQPVVVSPQPQEDNTDDDAAPLSPDTDYEDVFLLNNICPEETSTSLDTTITEESIEAVDAVPNERSIVLTPDTENESEAIFSESDSHKGDVDTDTCSEIIYSKIPRRIRSISKISNSHAEGSSSDKLSKSVTCSESTGKGRRFSKDGNNLDCDKTYIPVKMAPEGEKSFSFPKTFRSSKRNSEHNTGTVNTKLNEQEKHKNILNTQSNEEGKHDTIVNNKSNEQEKRIPQARSTPSLQRKPVVTSGVPRKTPTPVFPRKNSAPLISKIQPPRALVTREAKKDHVTTDIGMFAFFVHKLIFC